MQSRASSTASSILKDLGDGHERNKHSADHEGISLAGCNLGVRVYFSVFDKSPQKDTELVLDENTGMPISFATDSKDSGND